MGQLDSQLISLRYNMSHFDNTFYTRVSSWREKIDQLFLQIKARARAHRIVVENPLVRSLRTRRCCVVWGWRQRLVVVVFRSGWCWWWWWWLKLMVVVGCAGVEKEKVMVVAIGGGE